MNTKKQIYTKDKKVKITFRCDEGLSDWIEKRSALVSLTPSAFVRQLCFQNFYAETAIGDVLKNKASTETAATNANE